MNESIRNLCFDAMGIALFVVCSLCMNIPVFENYYLCMGYVVFGCYCFRGVKSAACVGGLGVVVYCVLINGLRGMIGWSLANVVIGMICGCAFRFINNIEHKYIRYVLFVLCIVVSCFVGIVAVKSSVEWILFKEPFLLRTIKNSYAFIADVIVMMIGVIIYKRVSIIFTYLKNK